MRRERTEYERLMDNAVLLTLWAEAQKRSNTEAVGDKLKLMKLAFLATYPLFLDRVKALNLQFYRWNRGPMANQVYDTLGDLTTSGLLLDEEEFIVSEEGMRFVDSFRDEVLRAEENRPILQKLEEVVEEYALLETPALLAKVYDLWCFTLDSPGRKRKVEVIPQGRHFTRILEDEEAELSLQVPPGWLMTLELTFHPTALRDLQRGIEDCHAGRVEKW